VAERKILIVDSSEAFATMLQQGLKSCGPYRAVVAQSGTQALDMLAQNQIDLAIVDMGLEDMDGPTLVQSLRQNRPDLCIILIPLFGQQLEDPDLLNEIQGVLPKPFFIGDLPQIIQKALGQPAETEAIAEAPAPAPERPRVQPSPLPRAPAPTVFTANNLEGVLQKLFEEIRAEAVLFIRGAELIAHAGNVTRERAQELAVLAEHSLNAAHRIAAFLGEPAERFEQCTYEGSEYSVYSTDVTPQAMLSVAISARAPVGMVRYNLRRAAQALSDVWRG